MPFGIIYASTTIALWVQILDPSEMNELRDLSEVTHSLASNFLIYNVESIKFTACI